MKHPVTGSENVNLGFGPPSKQSSSNGMGGPSPLSKPPFEISVLARLG